MSETRRKRPFIGSFGERQGSTHCDRSLALTVMATDRKAAVPDVKNRSLAGLIACPMTPRPTS